MELRAGRAAAVARQPRLDEARQRRQRQPYAPALGTRHAATPMEPEASLYLAGLHPRPRYALPRARRSLSRPRGADGNREEQAMA
ncbi:MAG: hypothetical protein MZV65_43930 [Chromatiales bacterium]|nr:hypothetical protein [Chromatiales bacterium]